MALKKGKIQGKKNVIKIKSKTITPKRALKSKKSENLENTLDKVKWLNKMPMRKTGNQCDTSFAWFESRIHKQNSSAECSSAENISDVQDQVKNDEDKYTSDGSGECDCCHSRSSEKNSCTAKNSEYPDKVVAKYIQSGINHVASFIVESAIRFGEEHGVVVPDKNFPNIYEINTPNDKFQKIRLKFPKKNDFRKSQKWNRKKKSCSKRPSSTVRICRNRKSSSSWESTADSLEEILPLLEKLEKDGEGIVNSELDLDELKKEVDQERNSRKNLRPRDKFMNIGKRYKSVESVSEKRKYMPSSSWKKLRRDSAAIERQRRCMPASRKETSASSY